MYQLGLYWWYSYRKLGKYLEEFIVLAVSQFQRTIEVICYKFANMELDSTGLALNACKCQTSYLNSEPQQNNRFSSNDILKAMWIVV